MLFTGEVHEIVKFDITQHQKKRLLRFGIKV